MKHNLTIRCNTMIAQRLLEANKEEVVSFQKYVLELKAV
jgi:hypothetical protein